MDWFECLTGFSEQDYAGTRALLRVEDGRLTSNMSSKSYGVGTLELPSLNELRDRVHGEDTVPIGRRRIRVCSIQGDARELHRLPAYRGALFQVASQFNMLEMTGPAVTPEDGVTGYQSDRTQGPACAIAAGAATIYRNYFAPIGTHEGQTAQRQLDGLADVGHVLGELLSLSVADLWSMRNGYALCTQSGLAAISRLLASSGPELRGALKGHLRIGLHHDVEVTDVEGDDRPVVSQAFCSALPVAYSAIGRAHWAPFAKLVLEAAYEATLLAALERSKRGASSVVLFTLLGGGAFGNEEAWILDAIRQALTQFSTADLDVGIVGYRPPARATLALIDEFR